MIILKQNILFLRVSCEKILGLCEKKKENEVLCVIGDDDDDAMVLKERKSKFILTNYGNPG